MADAPKTVPTDASAHEFVDSFEDEKRRTAGHHLLKLMSEATGDEPVMWGPTMIGFGSQRYKYASGREGDWPKVGFALRAAAITFYGLLDHAEVAAEIEKIGKHTTGRGCVYVKKLADIDEDALKDLVGRAYRLANGTFA
ncbi:MULTISPECIES: DUF1801 domain-containing protein [unclassified Cryobacterium]|uniref:DUF1801 domain-containing protein n=1 Tax=unclassified Cryobacterium TaxID=2649013 RepID=UPI0014478B7C|nr:MULTISPECIES: DUF1801 domain-containing protein [unclassified Cryobacterium]